MKNQEKPQKSAQTDGADFFQNEEKTENRAERCKTIKMPEYQLKKRTRKDKLVLSVQDDELTIVRTILNERAGRKHETVEIDKIKLTEIQNLLDGAIPQIAVECDWGEIPQISLLNTPFHETCRPPSCSE